MKIKKFLTGLFKKPVIEHDNKDKPTDRPDLRQREKQIYGEQAINDQRLYEKWVVKKAWHLEKEAIPLLLGQDPANEPETSLQENIKLLTEHAKHCVEHDLLTVINRHNDADEWKVKPVDIYRWAAVSRVQLPQALTGLMEFIISTIKSTDRETDSPITKGGDNQEKNTKAGFEIENILGLAVTALAYYPDQCRDDDGNISADKIISIINKYEADWLNGKVLESTERFKSDLINRWLDININA